MFTGIIEHLGKVAAIHDDPPGVRLIIAEADLAARAKIGDSIAIAGCCLTVVTIDGDQFGFDAGSETLSRTVLGTLKPGSRINMEASLKVGDTIGGHFVAGHVDAVGTLDKRLDEKDWSTFWFRVPEALTRQMATKGSVTIDGVSLTLVDVEKERFSLALIPHTLSVTTLGTLKSGDGVNVETDVLAKYVERQLFNHDGTINNPFSLAADDNS